MSKTAELGLEGIFIGPSESLTLVFNFDDHGFYGPMHCMPVTYTHGFSLDYTTTSVHSYSPTACAYYFTVTNPYNWGQLFWVKLMWAF